MALKLKDIRRGDSKRYRLTYPVDIAGAAIVLTMKKKAEDADAAALLQKQAVLDAPDGNGEVFGATIEITAAESRLLPLGSVAYDIEHTTAGGDVATLIVDSLRVLVDITQGE